MAGIATLKKALKFLFDVAKSAEVKLEDGKLSFPEVITLAYDARGVLDLIKERKELGEEIVDVTDEEFDELVVWAKEEFELDNDEVEALVEDLLDFIAQGTKVFWDIKALINKE